MFLTFWKTSFIMKYLFLEQTDILLPNTIEKNIKPQHHKIYYGLYRITYNIFFQYINYMSEYFFVVLPLSLQKYICID